MSRDLLFAFVMFAFATSITPGPNNVMLLASGANHGLVRTLPQVAGICLGCVLMILLAGLGVGELLATAPMLYAVLRYAGAAYLLVLAWRTARAGSISTGRASGKPMRFLHAAAFQWVNPKAWVMVVGAVTTYGPHDGSLWKVGVIAAVFALINVPSVLVWAGCGVAMRRVLSDPRRMRVFNLGMALLLVLSLYPVLKD